jgi:hypothetical protein
MVSDINFCKLITSTSKHTKRHKINASIIGVAVCFICVRYVRSHLIQSTRLSSIGRALCSPSRPRWLHRWAVVKYIMHFAWSASRRLHITAPAVHWEWARRGCWSEKRRARGGILYALMLWARLANPSPTPSIGRDQVPNRCKSENCSLVPLPANSPHGKQRSTRSVMLLLRHSKYAETRLIGAFWRMCLSDGAPDGQQRSL